MNVRLLAYLCSFALITGVVAAFIGSLSWGGVGLIFLGVLVACFTNGAIIGTRLRKSRQQEWE